MTPNPKLSELIGAGHYTSYAYDSTLHVPRLYTENDMSCILSYTL